MLRRTSLVSRFASLSPPSSSLLRSTLLPSSSSPSSSPESSRLWSSGYRSLHSGQQQEGSSNNNNNDNQEESKVRLVLTAAGPDRVGVTAAVTKALVATNGNVDSGRLTSLGGDWCMHMLVTVPENSEQDFRKLAQNAISEFGDWDLTIRKNTMRQAVSHQRRRLVKLSGEDKPGIMHAASAFFAQLNINILSMSVHIEPAPFTSSPLFKLEALIQVPDELTDEKLEEGLEDVGEKEEVDMWIETGEAPEFLPETA